MGISGDGMDITACASLFGLCFLTIMFIQILRFAMCKTTFDPVDPFKNVFDMTTSGKCNQGFSVTTMLVSCACMTFILIHLMQHYHERLLNPSSLTPSNYR